MRDEKRIELIDAADRKLDRTRAKQADAIKQLIRATEQIKQLERTIARLERPRATPATPQPVPPAPPPQPIAPAPQPTPTVATDSGIPAFLRRTADAQSAAFAGDVLAEVDAKMRAEADAKEATARAALIEEVAERKRAKSRGRIAKLKAKQAGDTKRMPLSGRDAERYLRSL